MQLRRLAVLLDGQDDPILRLRAGLEGQSETVRRLLASALAAVETATVKGQSRPQPGISGIRAAPDQTGRARGASRVV